MRRSKTKRGNRPVIQRLPMSYLRFNELKEAGPEITAEDHERLQDFRPRPTKIAVATRVAVMYHAYELMLAKSRQRAKEAEEAIARDAVAVPA